MSSTKLSRNLHVLQELAHCTNHKRKQLIQKADKDLIKCLLDCSCNVLKGNIPLEEVEHKRLKRHQKTIRKLASKRVSLKSKKVLLMQKGGALPHLLLPILAAVASSIL